MDVVIKTGRQFWRHVGFGFLCVFFCFIYFTYLIHFFYSFFFDFGKITQELIAVKETFFLKQGL